MTEQLEPHKPQGINKLVRRLVRWLILFIFILVACCLIVVFDFNPVERLLSNLPRIDHGNPVYFFRTFFTIRSAMMQIVFNEGSGVEIVPDRPSRYITGRTRYLTDEEAFISGMPRALRGSEDVQGFRAHVRDLVDAGIFQILVQDNICFIRIDLNKYSSFTSRIPSWLRSNIAREVASFSREFWRPGFIISPSNVWTVERVERGNSFLGNSNINSPTLFTEEMNYIYLLAFIFYNDPPISISAFP